MMKCPSVVRSLLVCAAALGISVVTSLATASEAAAAPGNADAGRAFFSRCAGCHSASPGVNKIGPSLAGIVGSESGAVPGFNFSPAMKNAKVTWDAGTLDKFLRNPNGFVAGTKMFFTVSNAADRQNVIAYLETLKR
jgi:cytochrome c